MRLRFRAYKDNKMIYSEDHKSLPEFFKDCEHCPIMLATEVLEKHDDEDLNGVNVFEANKVNEIFEGDLLRWTELALNEKFMFDGSDHIKAEPIIGEVVGGFENCPEEQRYKKQVGYKLTYEGEVVFESGVFGIRDYSTQIVEPLTDLDINYKIIGNKYEGKKIK